WHVADDRSGSGPVAAQTNQNATGSVSTTHRPAQSGSGPGRRLQQDERSCKPPRTAEERVHSKRTRPGHSLPRRDSSGMGQLGVTDGRSAGKTDPRFEGETAAIIDRAD